MHQVYQVTLVPTIECCLFTWIFLSFLRIVQSYQRAQGHIWTVSYRLQFQYSLLDLVCDWTTTLIVGLADFILIIIFFPQAYLA